MSNQFDQTERQFSARIHQPSTFDGMEVYSFFVLYWLLEQYTHFVSNTTEQSANLKAVEGGLRWVDDEVAQSEAESL